MFQLRAAFSEQVEWRTSLEAAREFFRDLRNFVELMPGVERITADARGLAQWLTRAEVPGGGPHPRGVFGAKLAGRADAHRVEPGRRREPEPPALRRHLRAPRRHDAH